MTPLFTNTHKNQQSKTWRDTTTTKNICDDSKSFTYLWVSTAEMAGIVTEPWSVAENGNASVTTKGSSRELRHGRTAHNMSSSSLRKKSDLRVIQKVPYKGLKDFLSNLQEVILGTKLAILFPAVPAAIICTYCGVSQVCKL